LIVLKVMKGRRGNSPHDFRNPLLQLCMIYFFIDNGRRLHYDLSVSNLQIIFTSQSSC
jgi:hypothetical protein